MPIRPLSKELQEVAEKELNEVPSRVQADLDHLREWISQQPHLNARTDDQWLLTFLRGSKFSLQKAKEKLDFYYTARTLMPELHTNRDPLLPEIQEVLNRGIVLALPKTAHPGAPRVVFSRCYKLDPEKISLVTCSKLTLMIMDILMWEDDNFVVAGDCFVTDLKNFPFSYTSQLTPDFCKKIFLYSQKIYPVRLKEAHYLNTPSPIVGIYNMVKVFFSEKIRNRIFFWSEENLKKSFVSNSMNATVLPQEYGGEEISCDELAAYWKAKVESYRDWFLEDDQYGTDETKRIGKPKTPDAMFGVEGSFIKLEID